MKPIKSIFLAALFAFAVSSQAAVIYDYITVSNIVLTNVTSGNITSNGTALLSTNFVSGTTDGNNITLDVRGQSTVCIQVCTRNVGANCNNCGWAFAPSVDGVWFDRTAPLIVRPETGTTNALVAGVNTPGGVFVYTTNLNVGGIGYLRLTGLNNWDTNTYMTNICFKWAVKR
jgi:hypothetical protein